MPVTTLSRDEFKILSVSGKSKRRGDPDTLANSTLRSLHFVEKSGADLSTVYQYAVPKAALVDIYRIRINGDGDRGFRATIFVQVNFDKEVIMDDGRVLHRRKPDPKSEAVEFTVEGKKLDEWKILCLPIPQPGFTQVPPETHEYIAPTRPLIATELKRPVSSLSPIANRAPVVSKLFKPKKTEVKKGRSTVIVQPASKPAFPIAPPSLPVKLVVKTPEISELVSPSPRIAGEFLTDSVETGGNGSRPVAPAFPPPPTIVRVPVNRIRRFEGQPRKIFKTKTLRELGESMRQEGQRVPVEVIKIEGDPDHDHELIGGERRWRAAQLVGLPYLDAIVRSREEIPNSRVQHRKSFAENVGRESMSHLDIALGLVKEKEGGASVVELQKLCAGKSDAWVYSHMSLVKLVLPLRALLDPTLPRGQRLTFQMGQQLAMLPPEQQEEQYRKALEFAGPKLRLLKLKEVR